MTKEREALKQAISWADFYGRAVFVGGGMDAVNSMNEWRAALAEALAQPDDSVEQEPVARVIDNGTPEGATEWIPFDNRVEPLKTGDLLYTAPPKREWVELTEAAIDEIYYEAHRITSNMCIVTETTKQLKEKNHR